MSMNAVGFVSDNKLSRAIQIAQYVAVEVVKP